MGVRMDVRLAIAVVGAVFFAASAFPGISSGLEGYSPGHLALLRFLVASLALGVYAVLSRMRLPGVRDLPALGLLGFLAFSVYNVLLGYGQLTVPAGTASLLIASIPAFTALWAVAFLKERVGLQGWLGISVSFFGVALISFGSEDSFGADPGAFLVLLAALSASAYFALQKPYLEKYGAFELTTYAIWAGTLFLLPFAPGLIVRYGRHRWCRHSPSSTSGRSRPRSRTPPPHTPSPSFRPPERLPSSR
jgi:drug/metabolite transporter (DMT)-like permease